MNRLKITIGLMLIVMASCEAGEEIGHAVWVVVLPHLADLAQTVALVLIPMLMWQIKNWIKSKSHSASFNCAMDKVFTTLETSILNVGHTYVKEVKASGTWGGESAAIAKVMAVKQAKEMLGSRGLGEIKGCLGLKDDAALDGMFEKALESVLAKTKLAGLIGPGGSVPNQSLIPTESAPTG
jgi:hypothetical protein